MRVCQVVRLSMFLLLLFGTMAHVVSAEGPEISCCDSALRVGAEVYGSPVSSGHFKLEGAVGFDGISLAAWADIVPLPTVSTTLGGELKLSRSWLSFSVTSEQDVALMAVSMQGRADPPAWMLYDGVPCLIGGLSAIARAGLLKQAGTSEITLSPYLSAVFPAGDVVVSPSLELDVRLDSGSQAPSVSGSYFATTFNAGIVLIANSVHFAGLFEAFSSLVVSIHVPDVGLTVSGSLNPSGDTFLYRIGVGYEWGNTSLLPALTGKPGTICTGDVCF